MFAQLLLENGADPNIGNLVGATALHLAAFNEKAKCVDSLLTHGADAKLRIKDGPMAGRRPKDMTEHVPTIQIFNQHRKKTLGIF